MGRKLSLRGVRSDRKALVPFNRQITASLSRSRELWGTVSAYNGITCYRVFSQVIHLVCIAEGSS